MLAQAPMISLFVNQQTGKFDLNQVTAYRQALNQGAATNAQYAEQANIFERCWRFAEKSLHDQLLMSKYQALLAGCMMSNPVSAKASFDAQNVESQILLAFDVSFQEITIIASDTKTEVHPHVTSFKQQVDRNQNRFLMIWEIRIVEVRFIGESRVEILV